MDAGEGKINTNIIEIEKNKLKEGHLFVIAQQC